MPLVIKLNSMNLALSENNNDCKDRFDLAHKNVTVRFSAGTSRRSEVSGLSIPPKPNN